ncbi:MAG: hypothetical protein NTX25_13655, partial [Proteobacteria bacterium]|nr:hypothetical protein [Pseudomonadota bacterium]
EDAALSELMTQLEPPEIALLINTLSSERGNIMTKHLSQTQIKDACQFLDSSPKELASSIRSLAKKLEQASEKSGNKVSQKQRRFIFRLARKASLAEEEFVKMLIPAEDWPLKQSIMELRFFFCDLKYVSPSFLRETIDGFKMSFRAEILFLLPDELRTMIIETYTQGSRLRDLLTTELEDVKQNPQRSETVEQSREAIIDKFMEKFRARFVADPRQMREVILKQCELNNWQPPAEFSKSKANSPAGTQVNSAA